MIKDQIISLRAAPKNNPDKPGNFNTIVTPISQMIHQLNVGHRVLLDDGYLSLKVIEKFNGLKLAEDGEMVEEVKCIVVVGGELKPKKGINVPDLKVFLF